MGIFVPDRQPNVNDNESEQYYKDPLPSSAYPLHSNSEARLHLQGFQKDARRAMKNDQGDICKSSYEP